MKLSTGDVRERAHTIYVYFMAGISLCCIIVVLLWRSFKSRVSAWWHPDEPRAG